MTTGYSKITTWVLPEFHTSYQAIADHYGIKCDVVISAMIEQKSHFVTSGSFGAEFNQYLKEGREQWKTRLRASESGREWLNEIAQLALRDEDAATTAFMASMFLQFAVTKGWHLTLLDAKSAKKAVKACKKAKKANKRTKGHGFS